jgi:hypothetical protein
LVKVAVGSTAPEGTNPLHRCSRWGFSSQYAALYCSTLYYEIMSLVIEKQAGNFFKLTLDASSIISEQNEAYYFCNFKTENGANNIKQNVLFSI